MKSIQEKSKLNMNDIYNNMYNEQKKTTFVVNILNNEPFDKIFMYNYIDKVYTNEIEYIKEKDDNINLDLNNNNNIGNSNNNIDNNNMDNYQDNDMKPMKRHLNTEKIIFIKKKDNSNISDEFIKKVEKFQENFRKTKGNNNNNNDNNNNININSLSDEKININKNNNVNKATENSIGDDNILSISNFILLKTLDKTNISKTLKVQYKFDNIKTRYFNMKITKKSKLKTEKDIEHIENEIFVLKKINNINTPFLINLYFSFQTERKLYTVTDFCCNGNLLFHIQNNTKKFTNIYTTKFYLVQVLWGIKSLHSNNIFYRNLSPESIYLFKDGYIKLADFSFSIPNFTDKDRTRSLVNIPEYTSPEVLLGKSYGLAYDVWCIGVLMFEMLFGEPPFRDQSIKKLYKKIIFNAPKFEEGERFSPSIHLDAVNLMKRMMDKDPDKRPGVEEILEDMFFNDIDISGILQKKVDIKDIPIIPKTNEDFYIENSIKKIPPTDSRSNSFTNLLKKNFDNFEYQSEEII